MVKLWTYDHCLVDSRNAEAYARLWNLGWKRLRAYDFSAELRYIHFRKFRWSWQPRSAAR